MPRPDESSRRSLSVVLPAHNEAESLPTLVPQILEIIDRSGLRARIIVVDDGSVDETADVVAALARRDPRVELVSLSRNFGHQAALLAGLHRATEDAVVTMDADGQHPPQVLEELIERWRGGAEVVNTIRDDSGDARLLKRLTSAFFYRVFSLASGISLPPGSADFRLLSRDAAKALILSAGNPPFLRGTVPSLGFRQDFIHYVVQDRIGGRSSFGPVKMLRMTRDALLGHPTRLISFISLVGVSGSILALTVSVYAVGVRLFTDEAVPGWASVMAFVSLQMFAVFLILSLVAALLSNVMKSAAGKPVYITREHSSD